MMFTQRIFAQRKIAMHCFSKPTVKHFSQCAGAQYIVLDGKVIAYILINGHRTTYAHKLILVRSRAVFKFALHCALFY